MATPTLAQLMEVADTEAMADWCVAKLAEHYATAGIDVDLTNLQNESAARAFVFMAAAQFADRTRVQAAQAAGLYLDLAEGDWLSVYAASEYQIDRGLAVKTAGTFDLLPDSSAGLPQSIAAGDLVVRAVGTELTFRNTAAASLTSAGTSVSIAFEAETAGGDWNLQPNAALELVTPISGVTVSNPATDWITVEGTDEETDTALRIRCESRWASLAYATGPRDAYVYWATSADTAIRRVQVDDQVAPGTGQVGVYLASDNGPSSPVAVANVDAYINGATSPVFVPARHPIGATVTVQAANPLGVLIAGTLTHEASFTNIAGDVQLALDAFFSELPVGGRKVNASGGDGKVLLGELYRVVLGVPGVINFAFSSPVADINVPVGSVAQPTYAVFGMVPI